MPSPKPAIKASPGTRSGSCSACPPQPQPAAIAINDDQLDQDHRHNADERMSQDWDYRLVMGAALFDLRRVRQRASEPIGSQAGNTIGSASKPTRSSGGS